MTSLDILSTQLHLLHQQSDSILSPYTVMTRPVFQLATKTVNVSFHTRTEKHFRMAERPTKRPRIKDESVDPSALRSKRAAFLSSLTRPVSPPEVRRSVSSSNASTGQNASAKPISTPGQTTEKTSIAISNTPRTIPSPFKLTRVTGLPAKDNIDTISLHDILGDPLIKQAWIFNFCFDVDYTMRHFDVDVRQSVDVRIVHGSWKAEDGNRQGIEDAMKTWTNVKDIKAYLPDPFGTHHSKMNILFKNDDTAQVSIHTANMLEKDWEHMTNAVWQSPVLQKLTKSSKGPDDADMRIGGGQSFKHDLLRYIKAYGSKLKALSDQLNEYDFSNVHAAIIASVPSKVKVGDSYGQKWGHLALKDALLAVRSRQPRRAGGKGHLVSQVSSIASLPATWLDDTIYRAVGLPKSITTSMIYPTQQDLQESLRGYATGGSIHTKIDSIAQQKQVTTLRPQLYRWAGRSAEISNQAGRHLVPPHVKTYIYYTEQPSSTSPVPNIDWVLVTSANLSKQAWGTAPSKLKGVRANDEAVSSISSFEIGVLVWPEMFDAEAMVPTFGRDTPDSQVRNIVGFRMPYDLPLTPYKAQEMPWSPSTTYSEPDRLGQKWQ